ncbi:MAG TPA: hypothetical protein VHC63_02440 [Acidimicrobiales bacterium]|nr:hypothetical protein [Acidimicrobiales bacterium]
MKRLVATVVAAVALAASACNAGVDRYRPKFAAAEKIAAPNGPVVFTVGSHDEIVYGELRTFDLYSLRIGGAPTLLRHLPTKPDSLTVDQHGVVYVAARDNRHHLAITRYANGGEPTDVWRSGASRFAAHVAIAPHGPLIVGWHDRLLSLNPRGSATQVGARVSDGWTDPVFSFGRGNRIWVTDNALPLGKERAARGRDKSIKHRNRFAAVMPPYTNPSGVVLVKDELLLCSRTHHKVYRLHIGIDDAPHWRGLMAGLYCDRDIGLLSDGSLITAQTNALYRYPAR